MLSSCYSPSESFKICNQRQLCSCPIGRLVAVNVEPWLDDNCTALRIRRHIWLAYSDKTPAQSDKWNWENTVIPSPSLRRCTSSVLQVGNLQLLSSYFVLELFHGIPDTGSRIINPHQPVERRSTRNSQGPNLQRSYMATCIHSHYCIHLKTNNKLYNYKSVVCNFEGIPLPQITPKGVYTSRLYHGSTMVPIHPLAREAVLPQQLVQTLQHCSSRSDLQATPLLKAKQVYSNSLYQYTYNKICMPHHCLTIIIQTVINTTIILISNTIVIAQISWIQRITIAPPGRRMHLVNEQTVHKKL